MQFEDQIQKAFIKWLKYKHPHIPVIHIPNGKKRSVVDAINLKQMGVMAGASDLFFPSLYLWVELKATKTSKIKQNQVDFLKEREEEGYRTFVAYGYDDLITKFEEFLDEHE